MESVRRRITKKPKKLDIKEEMKIAAENKNTSVSKPTKKRKLDDSDTNNTNSNNKKRKIDKSGPKKSRVSKRAPNPKTKPETKYTTSQSKNSRNIKGGSNKQDSTEIPSQRTAPNPDLPENEAKAEPLPKIPLNFSGALSKLENSVATTSDGKKVTLRELCEELSIRPMENGISMNLKTVRLLWNGKMDRGVLPFVESLIPKLIMEFKPHQQQDTFAELRKLIANKIATHNPDYEKNFKQILPDLVTIVANWGQASNASKDFTTFGKLFKPFFQDLPSARCSAMSLPDTRSSVWKDKVEFVYFIREDGPHKDLHKLIQLMWCALRLQILHLKPSEVPRTLYCFGILTSGYCVQLLQMRVELNSEKDYDNPLYELWAKSELDLAEFDEASLTKLMTWLIAIRTYHFNLKNLLKSWPVVTTARKCLTSKKISFAKTSQGVGKSKKKDDHASAKNKFKKDKSDDSDDDDDKQGKFDPAPNNNITNRPRSCETSTQQPSPYKASQKQGSKGNKEEVDQETLDAIVYGINNKEYSVLHENAKYNKRVLLVCTTVKHVRLFVVKVYGAECDNMHEFEVLKVLGQHPNVCELLAVTKLETGEILTVQPYYRDSDDWYNSDAKREMFPLVFFQLAKGLSHVHDCGIIHGDIKPYNFMVDSDCNTRIIDFDFSACVDTDDMERLGGTEGYYAPEWYERYEKETGDAPVTFKFDVWSLAITMCQYAGVEFGQMVDPLERRAQILEDIKSKSFLLWPVGSLIKRMLAIHPDDRPTASEVFDELVKVYGDCGIARNEVKSDRAVAQHNKLREDKARIVQQEPANKTLETHNNRTAKKRQYADDNDENRDQRNGPKIRQRVPAAGKRNKDAKSTRGILNDITNVVK